MNWPEHPSGRPASEEGPRQCRESSARTHGRRAGLWSPRRCAVTLGCVVIVGAHGHRRRHVVTGASPWSRGARGHRQGSGHRGGVWWSRGPRSSPVAYHLSIRMSIIYHLSIHPSSTHHPSINAGKSFRFWAKGLRFALSIDENVPPPGTSVAASLAAEAAGQLPLLTAPARARFSGEGRRWGPLSGPGARRAGSVQGSACSVLLPPRNPSPAEPGGGELGADRELRVPRGSPLRLW